MTKIKEIAKYFLIGMGFGSFFLLGVQLTYKSSVCISRNEFIIVILSSGIIGLYSFLFRSEKVNFLVAEIFHFILTLCTVLTVSYLHYKINNWKQYIIIFLVFLFIYAIVWCVMMLFTTYEIKEVNNKIKKDMQIQ